MTNVSDKMNMIWQNIESACNKAGRNPEDISLIGVTKYATIERTQEAIDAGVSDIGENRLEGFLDKYNNTSGNVNWHFIGTLQTRKVRDVIDKVSAVHSLDRLSLAKEIQKRATGPVDCFVQVNTSGEASKHGLEPEETMDFVKELEVYDKIRVVGLMMMAPLHADEQALREVFRKLSTLQKSIKQQQWSHAPCDFLSMGMSRDYQVAIEEGATHIRIGTDLIGDEPIRKKRVNVNEY